MALSRVQTFAKAQQSSLLQSRLIQYHLKHTQTHKILIFIWIYLDVRWLLCQGVENDHGNIDCWLETGNKRRSPVSKSHVLTFPSSLSPDFLQPLESSVMGTLICVVLDLLKQVILLFLSGGYSLIAGRANEEKPIYRSSLSSLS